jgi:hypothetical protein
MRKLEEFVTEKLKVSNKHVGDINLVDFVNCDNIIDYEALLETLRKEIKENAVLAPIKQSYDKLYKVVDSGKNIIYIFINRRAFFIGTYDVMYYVFADRRNKRIIVNSEPNSGFKNFTMNDNEMNQCGGVYVLPEYLEASYNELIKHAENYM